MFKKFFHYISYLSIFFFLWGGFFAFPELIRRTENVMSNIGTGVFLFGIALSLNSFKDSTKISKFDKKLFSSTKKIIFFSYYSIFWIFITLLIGLFFFYIEILYPSIPSYLEKEIQNIGLGVFSFFVGLACEFKGFYDRYLEFSNKT